MIHSSAPIRICDLGGWTDTWFAGQGRVLNVAVTPRVEVRLRASENRARNEPVIIHAADLRQLERSQYADPLLEATVRLVQPSPDLRLELWVHCDAPPGSSTGTSAATCVALLGALDQLGSAQMTPADVARAAHRVETELLKQQSGIQDQLAATYGGINYIEMDHYPHATVTPVSMSDAVRNELQARLSLIFAGQSHSSSGVHELVIRNLEGQGPGNPQLKRFRELARDGYETLVRGDLANFGRVMIENTEVQAELHPALVGTRHRQIIELAHGHGACGWKVNGAGGEGGSVTILHGADPEQKTELLHQIEAADPSFRVIPIALSAEGLRVRRSVESDQLSPGEPIVRHASGIERAHR